uniref:Ferritin n=1 Tax=Pinctada fucata TaxID=50426 RepID=Q7YW83_PINFU|nr:ferritin-like protein [Pinctada fucata]
MALSQPRQNFHVESEAGINRQINMELYASYTYQSMSFYFDRDDVALPGFAKFFKHSSDEEREHAEKLMKYQNKRGGRIVLQDIKKPDRDDWGTGLESMQVALQLEKSVNQSLLDLHKVADTHGDAQMMDFIESEYLEEQVNAIKEISDHITQLKRVGPGLGEYQYELKLQSSELRGSGPSLPTGPHCYGKCYPIVIGLLLVKIHYC